MPFPQTTPPEETLEAKKIEDEEIDPETLISVTKLPPLIQDEPIPEPVEQPPPPPSPQPIPQQAPVPPVSEPEPPSTPVPSPPQEPPQPPQEPLPASTGFPQGFQHLDGTEPCGNELLDCHTYSKFGSFSEVRKYLKAQFEQDGYSVTEDDDFEQGEQVFKLSKDNEVKYLNILSFQNQTTGEDTVVYTVTEKIALNELKQEYGAV